MKRRPTPSSVSVYGWQMLFMGAFFALRLNKHGAMMLELADWTRTDAEAQHVLELLRDGPAVNPIDRIALAMKWLQDQRSKDEDIKPS
jgi:hypothetical protein